MGLSLDLGLAFGLWPLVFGVFGVRLVFCVLSLCSLLVITLWSFLDSASCALPQHRIWSRSQEI